MIKKSLDNLKTELNAREDLLFIDKLHSQFADATIYLVGGAVRDYYLGKEISDLDFLVQGIEKNKLEEFLSGLGSIKDVESRAFGVFIFRPKEGEDNFDIALPRSDKWTGEGYKDLEVDIGVTIREDLARRDLTINAMAVDLRQFKLIDPFNGLNDLKLGLIKAVGNPNQRFKEDPSRILRGVRFSNQFGFKIDKDTFRAMKDNSVEIVAKLETGKKRVAPETIGREFLKSFDADTLNTIKIFDDLGLIKLLFPEIEAMKGVRQPEKYHSEGDVYKHTLLALEELEKIIDSLSNLRVPKLAKVGMLDNDFSIELKLGLLLHDLGKPATFTPPSEEKNRISFNEHDDVGAVLAGKVIKRLKLTGFASLDRLHVNANQVTWLVKKHMILVVAKPEEMRLSTLEKYFFHPSGRGKKLMTLSYCDISATVPASGKGPDYELLNKFLDQIKQVEDKVKQKQAQDKLPDPLLDGREIMEVLDIDSGSKVGEIKDEVRDLELSGKLKSKKEAKVWLEENRKKLI
jgi:poly(A) polymerase